MVFSREGNGYQFRENVQEQLTLAGRTAENRLYLSSSNEWNCPQTEKAYLWFFEKLTGFMGTEMRLDATLSAIRQGGSEKSRILHEMLYADLGIKDIRISVPIKPVSFSKNHRYAFSVWGQFHSFELDR